MSRSSAAGSAVCSRPTRYRAGPRRSSVYEQAPRIGEIGAGVFLTPNSVRHLQQDRIGAGGGEMGRARRPRFALLPPRRRADRAGPGDGLLGLERDLRHAPRRSRRDAGQAPCPRHRPHRASLHRFRAGRQHLRGCRSPTALSRRGRHRHRRRRHPLRASTICLCRLAAGVFGFRRLSGPGCRTSAFRIGRPTAGRCGSAREDTSSPFRCAPES